jgi:hypothetical protein
VDLVHARMLTGDGTSFLIFFIMFVPFFVSVIVEYTSSPIYGHGCTGCILYASESSLFLAQCIIIFAISIVLFFFLRKAEDALLILWEIKWSGLFAGVGALIGFIIDRYNPGQLHSSGVVTWGWFVIAGMFLAFYMCVYWPLYHALIVLAKRDKHQVLTGGVLRLDDVLNDPALKSRFAVHLMHELSIENLRFWDAANTWKNKFEANQMSREAQAHVIFETFVALRSTLEINISYEQKALVERNVFLAPELLPTAFDVALHEVHAMMARDSFLRFVSSQALDNDMLAKIASKRAGGGGGSMTSTTSPPTSMSTGNPSFVMPR